MFRRLGLGLTEWNGEVLKTLEAKTHILHGIGSLKVPSTIMITVYYRCHDYGQ